MAAPGDGHGFKLRDGGEIVGVIGGEPVEPCNLTSLSVVPRRRARTMDLFAHCLADATLRITNLTPNQAVERMSRPMRFRQIDPVQHVTCMSRSPGRRAGSPRCRRRRPRRPSRRRR